MSKLNVVDSSAWLEYLAATPNARHFAKPLEDLPHLVVPVLCIYEVFKKIKRERGEDDALQVASLMQSGSVADLDSSLALAATRYPMPLADSIIYATAQAFQATLWTQDAHFKGLPGVRYFPKRHKLPVPAPKA